MWGDLRWKRLVFLEKCHSSTKLYEPTNSKVGRSNKSQTFNQTVNQRQFLIGGRFFLLLPWPSNVYKTRHTRIYYLSDTINRWKNSANTSQIDDICRFHLGKHENKYNINRTEINTHERWKSENPRERCTLLLVDESSTMMMMMCILSAGIHCVSIQQYQHNMPNKAGTPIKCVQDKHWVSGLSIAAIYLGWSSRI